MQVSNRARRIINNLVYIIARLFSQSFGENEWLQTIIKNFIEGWKDGWNMIDGQLSWVKE